jgi:transposase
MAESVLKRLRGRGLLGLVGYLLLQALLDRPVSYRDFLSWADRLMSLNYPVELGQRAGRLVTQQRDQYQAEYEAIRSIAAKLGTSTVETLRKWVGQAEIGGDERPGTLAPESAELRRLRAENKELRRANDILKAASAFFAAELDRPTPRS